MFNITGSAITAAARRAVPLEVGDKVRNKIGRAGVVIAVDPHIAQVEFQKGGPTRAGWFDRVGDNRLTRV